MPNILLVCDDNVLAMLYSEELAEEGYEVVLATSAGQAYSKMDDEKPDLVLVDSHLGRSGESDLCEAFNSRGYAVPVVFCCDYPPLGRDAESMDLIHWVFKSSDLTNLKTALRKAVAGQVAPCGVSPPSVNHKPAMAEQISFDWTK
jgi:DNA-binding response OmpR family regulator